MKILKKRSHIFAILIFLLFGALPPGGVRGDSHSVLAEFEKARDFFQREEYARCLEILHGLENISPRHPLRPEIAFLTGQTLRFLRRWPEAAGEFSLSEKIFPLLADYALFHEGQAWRKAGEDEKSLEAFQRLIALYPQSLPAPRGGLKMAEIFLERGEFQKAAAICQRLLASPFTQDVPASALLLLGQAQEGMGKWGEALATYNKIWLEHPLHPAARKAEVRRNRLVREKEIVAPTIPPRALFVRAWEEYSWDNPR